MLNGFEGNGEGKGEDEYEETKTRKREVLDTKSECQQFDLQKKIMDTNTINAMLMEATI